MAFILFVSERLLSLSLSFSLPLSLSPAVFFRVTSLITLESDIKFIFILSQPSCCSLSHSFSSKKKERLDDGNGAALLGAQTGAFIAGAAASIVLLGPLAPVAVLGGAGVFAMYVHCFVCCYLFYFLPFSFLFISTFSL